MSKLELSKDIIGQKMEEFEFAVERGKIREFCLAIGDENPLFLNAEHAKKEGYEDTPVPLTFSTTFIMWGYGYKALFDGMEKMGIDVGRLLHLKEEYQYLQAIYPGDVVKGHVEVTDVKIGKMNMATFSTVFVNQSGKDVLKANMTIIIRPEGM